MANVCVQQRIYVATLGIGRIFEVKQGANFFQRHVQGAAVTYERQPFYAGLVIEPVVGLRPRRLGKQTFPLVKPDGLSLCLGNFGQFADLHVPTPEVCHAIRAKRSLRKVLDFKVTTRFPITS